MIVAAVGVLTSERSNAGVLSDAKPSKRSLGVDRRVGVAVEVDVEEGVAVGIGLSGRLAGKENATIPAMNPKNKARKRRIIRSIGKVLSVRALFLSSWPAFIF